MTRPRIARFELQGRRAVVIELAPASAPSADLTAAERAVAALAMRGMTDAEIAAERGTSVRTVSNQMTSVLRKTGATSRAALAAVLRASD